MFDGFDLSFDLSLKRAAVFSYLKQWWTRRRTAIIDFFSTSFFTKNCFLQFSLKIDSIYTALASESKFLRTHSSSTGTERKKCHDTVAQDLPAMVSAMDYGDRTVRTFLAHWLTTFYHFVRSRNLLFAFIPFRNFV